MIRINLLAEGRKPVVARRAKQKLALGDRDPSLVLLAAFLILGGLVAGGWWWLLHGRIGELNGQIARAQREVEELRPIIKEVEEYKAKQAELERKIAVIQDLKRRQQGPVYIMDQISRALPDLLWLERMSVNRQTVVLNGRAFNTSAVAAFLENLGKVPEFKEPVLRDMPANRNESTYSFAINFDFVQQKPTEDTDGAEPPPQG